MMLERHDDGRVTLLVIDRQERRNALDIDTVIALTEVFTAGDDAPPVVLAGAGTTFSSGFDLSTMEQGATFKIHADGLFDAMLTYPAPIFAAMTGPAVGMGAVLAACCDVRIGCASSWLEIPAARLGVVLGTEYVERVRQRLGIATAQLLFVASRRVDAPLAAQLGALHALHNEPITEAMQWARAVAELSATSLAAHKAVINGLAP
jgi:enoyl-CoA hydratase/carnithine racemase